jgi:hypothetical protein
VERDAQHAVPTHLLGFLGYETQERTRRRRDWRSRAREHTWRSPHVRPQLLILAVRIPLTRASVGHAARPRPGFFCAAVRLVDAAAAKTSGFFGNFWPARVTYALARLSCRPSARARPERARRSGDLVGGKSSFVSRTAGGRRFACRPRRSAQPTHPRSGPSSDGVLGGQLLGARNVVLFASSSYTALEQGAAAPCRRRLPQPMRAVRPSSLPCKRRRCAPGVASARAVASRAERLAEQLLGQRQLPVSSAASTAISSPHGLSGAAIAPARRAAETPCR